MLAILAAFLAAKSATPLEPGVGFHLRDGWKEVPGTHTHGGVLSVTIALTLPEAAIKGMEEALFYLSDPASPGFGQPHWSLAELATKVRPLLCAMLNIRHRETTQSLTRTPLKWLGPCRSRLQCPSLSRTLEMARSVPRRRQLQLCGSGSQAAAEL